MIEVRLVQRMLRRGLLLAPVAVISLWGIAGLPAGLGVLVGAGLALANLYLAGRIIGGLAENAPHLVLPGALGALALGMLGLTFIAIPLRSLGWSDLRVAGIALIATHLILVIWEAADAFLKLPRQDQSLSGSPSLRS